VPSSDQTGLSPVVAGRCGAACTDPAPLFVLTIFLVIARIRMILFPARPSRLNVM
jgi:hypothetical protein